MTVMTDNQPAAVSRRALARGKRRGGRRRALALLAFALLAAGAFYALYWRPSQQAVTEATATGPTRLVLSSTTYLDTVSGPGTLSAARSHEVSTALNGTLEYVIGAGERVAEGQTVARLVTTSLERAVGDASTALASAQAQVGSLQASQTESDNGLAQSIGTAQRTVADQESSLATAESALALARRLNSLGAVSGDELRSAQTAYDQAAGALESARVSLALLNETRELRATTNAQELRSATVSVQQAQVALADAKEDLAAAAVVAPFAGVVTAVSAQAGSFVNANATLVTLQDDSALTLVAQVDETDIGKVALGQPATVTVSAVDGRTFRGAVTHIAPVARTEQNIPIFDVSVTVENRDLAVRPGMTGEAVITVREVQDTVTVPAGAVRNLGGRYVVQVEQTDGTVAPHEVTMIASLGQMVVIQSDLATGTTLVIPDGSVPAGVAAGGFGQQGGPQGSFQAGPGFGGGGFGGGAFPGGGGGFPGGGFPGQ